MVLENSLHGNLLKLKQQILRRAGLPLSWVIRLLVVRAVTAKQTEDSQCS